MTGVTGTSYKERRMAGNCNSGRKPKYLTIQAFDKFKDKLFNNDLFHMKVELRVQSFVVGIILILVSAIAAAIYGG